MVVMPAGTFTVSATGVSLSAVVTTSDSEGSTAARRNDYTVARASGIIRNYGCNLTGHVGVRCGSAGIEVPFHRRRLTE